MDIELSYAERKAAADYLLKKIQEFPSELPTKKISEHAEDKRILPAGTPRPGPLDLSYTPYLTEIMDNMSPTSPIQRTIVMKPAQVGMTMAAECVLCYYMQYAPADQLFVSASETLLERWASRRLEPAIDSYGIRKLIYANENVKSSRRVGDKVFSKEYFGMRLDMASAQSASSLRSVDKKILIRDEIDGAPSHLKTGEGSWLDVSYARTNAWGARRKILDFSTPTTLQDSLILQAYNLGDKRKFFVPCPHCGKEQILKFENLKPEKQNGIVIDALYYCEGCGVGIFNHEKTKMLAGGKWVPTKQSTSSVIRSYHMNSLYAPVGMLSWKEIWDHYENAQVTPEGKRSFTNLYLGRPYRETGSRPKLENIIELRGSYKQATVPNGVLYLTMGIDVQRGSVKDPENPARIEFEILGHGPAFRTYSILYKTIEGDVSDPFSGAWEKLNEFAMNGGLIFKREIDGREFSPNLVFIDSGDGETMSSVYGFTTRWQNTFPVKGFQFLKKRQAEDGDPLAITNFKRYRLIKVSEDIKLYEISTNYYKTHLYNNLKIQRNEFKEQRPGFCDFPFDYNEEYFKMLTAEEKRSDGSFHCPRGRRNEALDCRVYAACAGDVFLDALVSDYKIVGKNAGMTPLQLTAINHKFVLDKLAESVRVAI